MLIGALLVSLALPTPDVDEVPVALVRVYAFAPLEATLDGGGPTAGADVDLEERTVRLPGHGPVQGLFLTGDWTEDVLPAEGGLEVRLSDGERQATLHVELTGEDLRLRRSRADVLSGGFHPVCPVRVERPTADPVPFGLEYMAGSVDLTAERGSGMLFEFIAWEAMDCPAASILLVHAGNWMVQR